MINNYIFQKWLNNDNHSLQFSKGKSFFQKNKRL